MDWFDALMFGFIGLCVAAMIGLVALVVHDSTVHARLTCSVDGAVIYTSSGTTPVTRSDDGSYSVDGARYIPYANSLCTVTR